MKYFLCEMHSVLVLSVSDNFRIYKTHIKIESGDKELCSYQLCHQHGDSFYLFNEIISLVSIATTTFRIIHFLYDGSRGKLCSHEQAKDERSDS